MIKKKILSEIIKNKNPISVEKFIEFCLYKKFGYYNNSLVLGKKGDFVTSPEISQLFGEIIGLFILNDWSTNINDKFNLIELGPGRGTLMRDILNITKKFSTFNKMINIHLIEKNTLLTNIQKSLLKNYLRSYNINWSKNFSIKNKLPCLIFANEFFDCFPIQQFYKKNNKWLKKMVDINHSANSIKFVDKLITKKNQLVKIEQYKPNEVLEFSNSREKYFNKICKHINSFGGKIIIIDYGYYERPNYFTLQSVYNNKKANIFDNIGLQDITALVDFKRLIEIAEINKLKIENFLTQREFFLRYGIKERFKILIQKTTKDQKKIIEAGMDRIINKDKMGNLFKILIISN